MFITNPETSRPARSRAVVGRGGLAAWLGFCLFALPAPAAEPEIDFNFQIRPILSDRCFACHGPDERTRAAHLRLDQAESAYAVRGASPGRQAVHPGEPDRSQLVLRIYATNANRRMPPPKSNLSLTDEEKDLLRRWVAQGAKYQPHWAFLPVKERKVPPAAAGSPNPIDAFVGARLAREGLTFSPEASREQLIRRLSMDLTGLPPTLAEIDAFAANPAPDAYERLVDRLLASPAYGERRANEWLDLARYADTYGYQADVDCDLSPWRDWVIAAFNRNLPYDRFLLWQVAGDLLPNATRAQVLATAFNRLHRQTNEGGSIEEEFRASYAADRVNTLSTAVLGLTMECARCHDHKFDPITQKDYYRMFAFFNNIDESGLYSHFTRAIPTPTLLLYSPDQEKTHRAIQEKIGEVERRLARLPEEREAAFAAWLARSHPTPVVAPPSAAFDFEKITNRATPAKMGAAPAARLIDDPKPVAGPSGQALEFTGDNAVECKGVGAFDRTTPFSLSLWLRPSEHQERAVVLHRSRAWTDSGSRGYELVLEGGRPTFSLIHFWPGNALRVAAREALPTNEWSRLAVTYDGSSRARGVRLYRNGKPLEVEVVRDHLYKDIIHRAEWGDADVGSIELTLAARFRDSGFRNGGIDELQVFDRELTPWEAAVVGGVEPANPSREELREYYLARVDDEARAARTRLGELRAEENRLVNDVPEIMVMREMARRRPTHVLRRGAYDAPGEAVEPGVPESILPWPPGLPANRLGLAQWLVDRNNPLTARVEVNRVWRTHFGRGLVATTENFGSQGELPTHPELLDWLAWRFMDSGWDLKALHKLIVRSGTYRQTSVAAPALLERDPDNRWLARGPKRRLEAEQIRDEALAVSGLLTRRIGGRSVKPYQPAGLWEESGTGKQYAQDKGDNLYRRSLYTFWRRTSPPPTMLAFDATSREVCTARREATATPLQALVLLHDPQFLEAARVAAEGWLRQDQEDGSAQLRQAFRQTLGRSPEPTELGILTQLYREQLEFFQREPSQAERLLAIGERPRDAALPAAPVAAMTTLVNALMNLDEFVMLR